MNEDTATQKAGGKTRVGLVPVALMTACEEALAEGRVKYGCCSWREKGESTMSLLNAALSHIYAYIDGEDIDTESKVGKRHLAGAVASLAILLDAEAHGTLTDNRPPKGPGARLLRAK